MTGQPTATAGPDGAIRRIHQFTALNDPVVAIATWLSCRKANLRIQLTGILPSAASMCNLYPIHDVVRSYAFRFLPAASSRSACRSAASAFPHPSVAGRVCASTPPVSPASFGAGFSCGPVAVESWGICSVSSSPIRPRTKRLTDPGREFTFSERREGTGKGHLVRDFRERRPAAQGPRPCREPG